MEHIVKLELSWEEYIRLLYILAYAKDQVNTPIIDRLYEKVYLERKVERV